MENIIEASNLSKQFTSVLANDNISIKVKEGTVHAIIGENGAGKSTLMNMLYGLHRPTSGTIKIKGEEVDLRNPNDAIERGVGMVHQHFMLIPTLTVAENIVLGKEPGNKAYFNRKKAVKKVEELCEKYNLYVDPNLLVSELSVGMQQRIEILKALYQEADILILDEPTAVLTPQEIQDLFVNIRNLLKTGKTVIIITHKLDEVLDISDNITVLRRGKLIGNIAAIDANEDILTDMMIGRDVQLGGKQRKNIKDKRSIIEVTNLNYSNSMGVKRLKDVSIHVNSGEIVGIAGIDNNGQLELVELLAGVKTNYSGEIKLKNENIKNKSVRNIKESGVGFIPEDRHKHGLVMDYTISENMICGFHYKDPFAKNYLLNTQEIDRFTKDKIKSFDIRTPSTSVNAETLSGGNQQKIVIARELSQDPDLIIATQPTRGLDVGAIEFVHDVLVETRNRGKGVLLVSLELDEIISLSDRVYVINNGVITGELNKDELDPEVIGRMMLGSNKESLDLKGDKYEKAY